MENKKPLLSICIPTYNRAKYLDKSILSIVSQKEFNSDDVELVISDNASTDNTEEVVRKYQNEYKNIFYSKNTENIRDKNFPTVIGNANGVFRKLCNDTLIFQDGAIVHLLDIIKENINKKPVVFFLNRSNKKKHRKFYMVDSFNLFVKNTSFWATWIGGFAIWEDDFEKIENKFDGCELSLWQTKVLFESIARKKNGLIDNKHIFPIMDVQKKDLSYGLYKVFFENYLGLYQSYLVTQVLSNECFAYLKRHLLFGFFMPWIANFHFNKHNYKTTQENIRKLILTAYRGEKYYPFYCLKLRILIFKKHIKNFIKGKIKSY